MKVFEAIQKPLVMLGIDPNESSRSNWKIAICFLLFILNILSSIIIIFSIEDDNLMAYMIGFCTTSASIEIGVAMAAMVVQQMKLIEFIEITEKLINQSNSSLVRFDYNEF